uniref:Uncharacterized protein n=1 Tax=Panagrolaimus sp. ES5 TaxID=591445 RepID=A0AC34FSP2_9BILA
MGGDSAVVRPTKITEYQYGFSTKLVENTRLIVVEKDDGTKCREYSAYRMHPRFLNANEKPAKHSKASTSIKGKHEQNETDIVAAAAASVKANEKTAVNGDIKNFSTFAKNSLDLIDAIKSLLPPAGNDDENSAPKKRGRRRKVSIQAATEALKTDNEHVDLSVAASTNATASIFDMIDTELLNNEKYVSEHSATSDTEDTDDCEIIEENMFHFRQNK